MDLVRLQSNFWTSLRTTLEIVLSTAAPSPCPVLWIIFSVLQVTPFQQHGALYMTDV